MARSRGRYVCHLVGLLLLICAANALKCPERQSSPGRELVCYTASQDLSQLENALCSCSTLVHQGHDLQDLGASEWKSLRDAAKEANPDIRIILSISDREEILKSSASTRQKAASQLVGIVKEVDGVELNVTLGSKDRLVSFVKSMKDELVNKSLERMILLALPTKPEHLAKQFELKELSKYVDLFTVATHYLRDSDEAHLTFHPSRLMGLFDMSNTDSIVDLISGLGAPKQKILVSVPTSAYQFTLKKAQENTPRSASLEDKPVALDRKKLCEMMSDGEWMVERDEDLTAPYAFKNTTWIAFEDETSLKIKGKYVILRELAGLALRDIENDTKNDCGISPAEAVHRAFTEMRRKTREVVLSSLERDLKGTEIAYPEHVRSSDFRIVRVIDTAGKIRAVRENTQTSFACSRQGYFTHPKSCNRFYRCVKFNQEVDDYSVFEFDCPAGLAFDERTEVCVWPGSVSKGSACPGSSEIEPVPRSRFRCPNHPGFYADPQNCRWFFACYDLGGPEMVPFEFRCPFGLVFDEQRLICEWPWKVPNCNGPGHGGEHSVYNYGANYAGGNGDYVPQGGIVGQGGFIGQAGYGGQHFGGAGAEADYEGQTYNGAEGGARYDGHAYNAADAGAKYDGQTYNNGAYGAGASYDGQNYNYAAAGQGGQTYNAAGQGGQTYGAAGQGGQTYNAAGQGGQTYNAAGQGGQTYGAAGQGGQTYGAAGQGGQTYNAAGQGGQTYGAAGLGGQTYNAAEADGGEANYNGQGYNSAGAEGQYDEQTYNAGGNGNAGFDDRNYDTAGEAGVGSNGQAYAGGADSGAQYGGQTYNAAGAAGAGLGPNKQTYDGQNYNADGNANAGAGPYRPIYNTAANAGPNYPGQTYNAGAHGGPRYDGQTYEGANAGSGPAYGDNRYDGQNYNGDGQGINYNNAGAPGRGADSGYNGQNFNGNAPGAGYDGPVYKGAGADCNEQNYNHNGAVGGADAGRVDINNRFDGLNINTGSRNDNKGIPVESSDYDDQRGTTASGNYNGQTAFSADGSGSRTTQFNSANAGTTVYANNLSGDTRVPTPFTASPSNFGKESASTAGYPAGKTNEYAAGVTNQYAAGATQQNAGGFTTDYAGATNYNSDINTFADQTGSSKGGASQNTLIANDRIGTNSDYYTNDYRNTEYSGAPQAQNTNYNAYATNSQTGYANNNNNYENTRLSTIGYTNNIENQNSVGFTNTRRPITYNSSYSANPGYPSSSIIPFADRKNSDGQNNIGTTPFNSIGLTSGEDYGTQYTNQAAKSFTQQGQNINGFTLNGRTQNPQNFNAGTNNYDASRINSGAGVTASYNRGGQFNAPATSDGKAYASTGASGFRDSTINTANYNDGVTTNYRNSDIVGSTLSPSGNDILKYRGTTDFPNNYQTYENPAANTGFRNDNNAYNQGGVTNQNAYISNAFSRTPIQNPVTPANPFNARGTSIAPLNNNLRPSVELDNSGLFGSNFAGSTTPSRPQNLNIQSTTLTPLQNTYRTNEYFDNGGRGTIRYNNGIISNKATGNDIQDYRTSSYTSIPSTFLINGQSPIQKYDSNNAQQLDQGVYTKEGFTKTGPTRTGITTAQVGGSGSYIIGNGVSRAKPNPQLIGEHAFSGNFGTTGSQNNFGSAGATNFNGRGNTNNFGSAGTTNFNAGGATNFGLTGTTNFNAGGNTANFGQAGTTNFDAGGNTANFGQAGTTNFNAGGNTANFGSTKFNPQLNANNFGTTNFNSRDETNFGETATTAEFGTSQLSNNLNTADGAQGKNNGYKYPRPQVQLEFNGATENNYFGSSTPSSNFNGQSYTNQNSFIKNIQNNKGFSTTISPIGFTTNQLENFRTTVYQAAKVPQAVSTVQPVYNNGFRTVISSTPVPAVISSTRQPYQSDNSATKPQTYLDVGVSFNQGNDYSSGNSDYSDYSTNLDQGNYGQRVTGQSNILNGNQNSQLITSKQYYGQNGQTDNGAVNQPRPFSINQANNYRAGVTGPAQVYLPSSTVSPAIGVTYRKPIVVAGFSQQDQYDRSSTYSNSINRNTAEFSSQGSSNRLLNNQAFSNFVPQNPAEGLSINQASNFGNSQGSNNGILRNQASYSFNSQGFSDSFANNQASANFDSSGTSGRLLANQAAQDFSSRVSEEIPNGPNGQISSSTYSSQNQGFSGQTRTLIGSSVVTSIGGSDINNDIIRQSIGLSGGNGESTTAQPEVTTYSGDYSRTRSRIESNSFNALNQNNKKVVVKLSDLHPLILGKLGAECTCKADPFAVFRGPNRQTLPINSQNRGAIDLANYDESDIYVDMDSDKENEKEIEFLRNIPSNRLIKPSDSGYNDALNDRGIVVTSRGDPVTSNYLTPTTARPATSTYLPPAGRSSTTYLPPTRATSQYLPPAGADNLSPILRENQAQSQITRLQDRQPLLIRVEDNANSRLSLNRERSGKSLSGGQPIGSANDFRDAGASFERYGPGGLRSNDETLQGELDCARPGLFRHPKFCNKFYACHWDSWKKRYTLHVFDCPVHLAFDSSAGACNYPTKGPACQDNKLLV